MFPRGSDAFDALRQHLTSPEQGRSSHWQEQLTNFQDFGDHFSGTVGFSDEHKPTRWRQLRHRIMRRRIEKLGAVFPAFEHWKAIGHDMAKMQDRIVGANFTRQIISAALLEDHCGDHSKRCAVIGDGLGTLTALLARGGFANKIIAINLAPVLLADLVYVGKVVSSDHIAFVDNIAQLEAALNDDEIKVIGIRADQAALLKGCPIDVWVNICSMQEMDMPIIENYFQLIRSAENHPWFYCCNRDVKTLPDGAVIRFSAYPWQADDEILIDEACPWTEIGFYTLNPPRYRRYDGPHLHKLARMSP